MSIKHVFLNFSTSHSHSFLNKNIIIDNVPIIEKKATKFLGVILDYNLSWNDHIKKITTSLSRAIGILYKLKHILTKKTLFMLYNALVLPHITYCNIVWGNSNKYNLDAILLLQKKAVRICTHSNYLAHADPIFYNLKTLKVDDIHTYQTSIFMFKHTQNLLPFFHNVFTSNSNIHTYPTRHSKDFHLYNPKLLLAHRSIRHHGPDTWNSLPDHLKICVSVFSFKSFMKKHILTKYNK